MRLADELDDDAFALLLVLGAAAEPAIPPAAPTAAHATTAVPARIRLENFICGLLALGSRAGHAPGLRARSARRVRGAGEDPERSLSVAGE
jgi:hypothetical protein